jgi:arylsulfatase A-like enzyme
MAARWLVAGNRSPRHKRPADSRSSGVLLLTCGGVLLLLLVAGQAAQAEPPPGTPPAGRPNVLLIMTDNHGAWTLGCYGNRDIRTPHIDALARDGVLFTRAMSSNGVCSPTRATYLTGLLPSQHGVHCFLRAGEWQVGPQARCTIDEFRSLGEILADAGYDCGLVGKWHLGGNEQPQEGFRYWVTMPHGATSTFYDAEVIEHGRIRREPQYLTDFWTEHALAFLRQPRKAPFFLFLSYNGPYGLGRSLLQPARNRHAEFYAEHPLESFPRETMHPWLFNNREYLNNLQAIRRVAAEVSGVDDAVGRVLAALRELGLQRDTVVIFTADQGWAGGQGGIWGMGDHTRPLHAFDSTMHVPLVWCHPGNIVAGRRSDLLVSNYDLLPSLVAYLGVDPRLPKTVRLPGRDYSPVLRGQALDWDNTVFYEFENTRAIRTDDWKYVRRVPQGPDELYDLRADPGERRNLVQQPEHDPTRGALRRRLDAFFDRWADPRYDLFRGGGSKVRLLSDPQKELVAW